MDYPYPLCHRVCTSCKNVFSKSPPLVYLFVVYCMINFVRGQYTLPSLEVENWTSDSFSQLVLYPGVYNFYWKPSSDGSSVTLILYGTGAMWLGIAWNSQFEMVGSEAVIGWVDPVKGAHIGAYDLNGEDVSLISPSTSLSLLNTSAELVNGVLTVMFTRSLNDGRYPLTSPMLTIGAYGNVASLEQHVVTPTEDNAAIISFLPHGIATVYVIPPHFGLREAHVLLELLAWNVMIPIGIFFARFGRNLPNALWFKVHQILQPSAFVIGVVGFILAFVMTSPGQHFTQVAHSEIGTIIIILALGQVLYGIFRPHKESKAHKWFEWIHPSLGVFIIVLVVIQTFLGIWQAAYPDFAYYVYLVYIVLLLALTGFLERRRSNENSKEKHYQNFEYL